MPTRKTSVRLDEELLEDVREALGTSTIRETIEEAFLEVMRQRARRDEMEALKQLEGMELDREDVMAGAWECTEATT